MSDVDVNVKTSEAAQGRTQPHALSHETGRVTKRLIFSLIACGIIFYFLNTHRAWTWAYFESLMTMKDPSPAVAEVAKESIKAITTVAIAGISAVTAVVMFFITGNVAALSALSKFTSPIGTAMETVQRKFTQTTTQRVPAPGGAPNRNWKSDPNER